MGEAAVTGRKICSKCRRRKSVNKFYRSKSSADGHGPQCKECMDAARARNKRLAAQANKVVPKSKKCSKCGKTKPAEDFSPAPSSTDGLYSYCKPCKAKMVKRHRDANKEIISRKAKAKRSTPDGMRKNRDATLRAKFGVGHDYYEARLEEQRGVCGICARERRPGEKHFSIDHEHDEYDGNRTYVHVRRRSRPLQLRGVLCERCNRGLGLANDDPDLLLAMARYLEKRRHP